MGLALFALPLLVGLGAARLSSAFSRTIIVDAQTRKCYVVPKYEFTVARLVEPTCRAPREMGAGRASIRPSRVANRPVRENEELAGRERKPDVRSSSGPDASDSTVVGRRERHGCSRSRGPANNTSDNLLTENNDNLCLAGGDRDSGTLNGADGRIVLTELPAKVWR